MKTIVVLSFLACVVLVASQTTTPMPGASPSLNATQTQAPPSSSTPAPGNTTAPTTTHAETTPTPTSGVVNVKAFAGFVTLFALIALF